MPYYVFAVEPLGLLRKLAEFEAFKDVSAQAKALRSAQPSGAQVRIKVMFADNPLAAEDLLLQVRPESPEWLEANRLLSFLQWFLPASPEVVPDNSILREFLGGSVLETFNFTPRLR